MKNLVLNIVFRMVMGIIGIFVLNNLFSNFGVFIFVGINALNLLTIGILGISGFGLLYAISAFSLL